MIISLVQLAAAITQMKYRMLGYAADKDDDLQITMELVPADPGSGQLVDVLKLSARSPRPQSNNKTLSMEVELFPFSEKQDPRADLIESFPIKEKY